MASSSTSSAAVVPEAKRDTLSWSSEARKEIDKYLSDIALRDNEHFWTLKEDYLKYWAEDNIVLSASSGASLSSLPTEPTANGPSAEAEVLGLPPTATAASAARKPQAESSDALFLSLPHSSSTPNLSRKMRPSNKAKADANANLPTLTLPHKVGRDHKVDGASSTTKVEGQARVPLTVRGTRVRCHYSTLS